MLSWILVLSILVSLFFGFFAYNKVTKLERDIANLKPLMACIKSAEDDKQS